jgi:hypothetical protein
MNPRDAAAAGSVLALALAGCAVDGSGQAAGDCAEPTPAPALDDPPPALRIDALGTVTEVARERRAVNAVAVTDGTIEELQPRVARALEDAGYTIVGQENEIVEADVFFSRGEQTTGGAKLLEGPCEGQVTIRLFVSR